MDIPQTQCHTHPIPQNRIAIPISDADADVSFYIAVKMYPKLIKKPPGCSVNYPFILEKYNCLL